MQNWLLPAIVSVFFWGLWGFFGKVAGAGMTARSVFLIEAVVVALVAILWLLFSGFKFDDVTPRGAAFAALTGMALAFGQLFFFVALARGKASVVISLTALYPIVTIALAFLVLRETITWTQGLGILLAAIALPLLSL